MARPSVEFPAVYRKERIAAAMQAGSRGETAGQRWDAFLRDWRALQQGPWFPLCACAAADEILSALYERIALRPREQSPSGCGLGPGGGRMRRQEGTS